MSNDTQTIHEFDLNIIYDYFTDTERQGPGSPEVTLKALSFIDKLSSESKIADIGCGTGGQTIVLAQNTVSKIIGIELWPDFIKQFNQNIQKHQLQDRVTGIIGDMGNLQFNTEELDLIWSEGAIYNIGFKRGLNEWRKFLKIGGYIAITENTWFSNQRPPEIEDFWQKAYPEIDTISNKVAQIEQAGYLPVATFVVPEQVWVDYYSRQTQRQKAFLEKYSGNQAAEEFIRYQQHEAELYRKYREYYGYVFYIAKRIR